MTEDEMRQFYMAGIQIQAYAGLLMKFYDEALTERLKAYGVQISGLQYGILGMLTVEALTISVISQRLRSDPSALVRAVDSMEKKGLVERGVDPSDRRRTPIHITGKGRDLMRDVPVLAPQDPSFYALMQMGPETVLALRDALKAFVIQFPEGRMVADLIENPPGLPPDHG